MQKPIYIYIYIFFFPNNDQKLIYENLTAALSFFFFFFLLETNTRKEERVDEIIIYKGTLNFVII